VVGPVTTGPPLSGLDGAIPLTLFGVFGLLEGGVAGRARFLRFPMLLDPVSEISILLVQCGNGFHKVLIFSAKVGHRMRHLFARFLKAAEILHKVLILPCNLGELYA
jgi:hypothetical protein